MQENKASRLFLICSLILGLLAAVVSFAYLNNSSRGDSVPKTMILVAAHDLRANSVLDPERDFVELPVPDNMTALKTRGLRPEDKLAYKGQRVNRMILAGTPIMLADIMMAAADLQPTGDNRAMSVPAKGAAALSGLLVPGDYVKLFVTYSSVRGATTQISVDSDPSSIFRTVEVLPEPVRLLAVGSHLSRSRQEISVADQFSRPAETESQQTVTLEVNEEQVKKILSACGAGEYTLWVVLCPPETDKK